jgi:hypothetical protein
MSTYDGIFSHQLCPISALDLTGARQDVDMLALVVITELTTAILNWKCAEYHSPDNLSWAQFLAETPSPDFILSVNYITPRFILVIFVTSRASTPAIRRYTSLDHCQYIRRCVSK